MAELQATLKQLTDGFEVPAGSPQNLTVAASKGKVVEMEDLHFHLDSAVVLPEPRNEADTSSAARDRVTGLAVIATCYLHAKGNPQDRLLIAGHADTSGTGSHNLALSRDRADNVGFLVAGRKAEWAALSDKNHKIEDVQAILKWIDRDLFPGMDPGEVDGEDGPLTQGALKAFQQRYNSEFDKSIPVDGKATLPTWEAFFDAYLLGLKQIMETDDAGLDGFRAGVNLLESMGGPVGCGENHPIDAPRRDGFRSKVNRRVELLFFDPAQGAPRKLCHPDKESCKPEKCDIYRLGLFDIVPLPVNPQAMKAKLLSISTLALEDEKVRLVIKDREGKVLRSLDPTDPGPDASTRTFHFDPDTLPAKVDLFFARNDLEELHAEGVDPSGLRDSLRENRLADASALAAGEPTPSDNAVAGPGGSPSNPAAGAQQLLPGADMRIQIRYGNPAHRLLKDMRVDVVNASFVAPASKQGHHVFDLPTSANEFRIKAEIPNGVLLLEQTVRVQRDGGRIQLIGASGSQHPRVRLVHFNSGGKLLDIRLNVAFLDVTAFLRSTTPRFDGIFAQNLHGCQIRVLEYTPAGKRPAAWTVAIPPGLDPKAPTAEMLLFFQHELKSRLVGGQFVDGPYTNASDFDHLRIETYLSDQPEVDEGGNPDPNRPQLGRYVTGAEYDNFPAFSWLRQLKQSGKKTLIALPMPHNVDMGVVTLPTQEAKQALEDLLLCLRAEKVLSPDNPGVPVLSRLAAGGFSSGTATLVKWLRQTEKAPANPAASPLFKVLREVYFFDGLDEVKPVFNGGDVIDRWMSGDKDRILRLICTAYTEVGAVALGQRHKAPPPLDSEIAIGAVDLQNRIRVLPGRRDYWYDNLLYAEGMVRRNGITGGVTQFKSPGQARATPAVDISDKTNVFLVRAISTNPPAGASVELNSPAAPRSGKVAFASFREVACWMDFLVAKFELRGQAVGNQADFDKVLKFLNETGERAEPVRVFKHRHAWCVIGGVKGFKGRQDFTGYFQICLELSKFT